MKTDGDLHEKARVWVQNTMVFFIICHVLTTMTSLHFVPRMAHSHLTYSMSSSQHGQRAALSWRKRGR